MSENLKLKGIYISDMSKLSDLQDVESALSLNELENIKRNYI
jgi:hypothetical protein